MAQTEGEKELVLGNKQLIGLFFVVIALCGVFFAMGYTMGRPAAKTAAAGADATAAPVAAAPQPQEPETPRDTPQVDVPPPPAAATDTAPSQAPAQAAATETQPARDTPAQPAPVAAIPPQAPPPPSPVAKVAVPQAGATYLQGTALRRGDADNLVKTLREQSLPAVLADSSKPELFRVLVGPYRQTADVADAKARLKALGFANAFVQKQ